MTRQSDRFRFFHLALFAGAVATSTTLSLLTPLGSRVVRAELDNSPKMLVDEVWQIVNRDYVDGSFNQTDWEATRAELLDRNYSSQEEAYRAVREALEQLNDPYTRFLDPAQYAALTSQTAGELTGVGIRLQLDEDTGRIAVVEPLENSPALEAGIQAGDRILAIDEKSTENMSVEKAAELIRGTAGTQVTLQIWRPSEEPFDLTLTRAKIELAAVNYTLHQEGGTKVGYIRLKEFSSHAAEQMKRAIETLDEQDAQAFVLDLRGNPGGLLYASIEIAQMWMDNGAIVRTVDRGGHSQDFNANHTAISEKPLAVLVDSNSASASEILAGALKDNGRATIIGTQTFGKALVQSVHGLSDGSGLTVTIAHYYTPDGTDISHKGITPDITIELSGTQRQQLVTNPDLIGTSEDPYYKQALSTLQAQLTPKPLAVQ